MAKSNTPAAVSSFRQPIVAILGHVDHGKTSLLDHIRQTHLAAKEAGGITQSIGAYQAEFQGRKLTFIDTPGHAAFREMRSRGAQVADLAVLVVAADDGVQPQTIESIKHLQTAKIPFIVAINKIDKAGVVPDTAKAQLTEHGVFVEGYGGNNPVVLISAKTGQGVPDLLENLGLLADLEELAYEPEAPLQAPIIEARKDMRKGNLVSVIVKRGTLAIGREYFIGTRSSKIRALTDDLGMPLRQALPGMPVQILGVDPLPAVGEVITSSVLTPAPVPASEPEVIEEGEGTSASPLPLARLNLILKTGTLGSLEAIKNSLAPEVNIVQGTTGDITEGDILLAQSTGSQILGFEVKVTSNAAKLAETEGVSVKTYRIIYELLEYLEKKVLRLLEPTIDEEELGRAKIIKIFEIDADRIAGSVIESGVISQGDTVHIQHKDGETKNARVKSIRIGKQEVKKVEVGKECGILFFPKLDLQEKDLIIAYKKLKSDED